MNTNEQEEIDISLKETIKTQDFGNTAVKNFVYEMKLYKQKIDNDENIPDEDKLEIEEFIKKVDKLSEEWKNIDGLIWDFFSDQDELWDKEEGELKLEYRI